MNYATFWQRFAAAWIDAFVLLPLTFIQLWLESISKTAAIVLGARTGSGARTG